VNRLGPSNKEIIVLIQRTYIRTHRQINLLFGRNDNIGRNIESSTNHRMFISKWDTPLTQYKYLTAAEIQHTLVVKKSSPNIISSTSLETRALTTIWLLPILSLTWVFVSPAMSNSVPFVARTIWQVSVIAYALTNQLKRHESFLTAWIKLQANIGIITLHLRFSYTLQSTIFSH
jgi:hypothetical protein